MLAYAMPSDYKRLNLSSLSKELSINYQALQYFLAEAKWNCASVNMTRINLLHKQRTTGFSKDGVLAIDEIPALLSLTPRKPKVSHTHTAHRKT